MDPNIKYLLDSIATKLRGTPDWNSPIRWRDEAAHAGFSGLDLPEEYGGKNLKLTDMAEIFAACGQIDLDLRDVPGGGHGRILTLAKQRSRLQNILIRNLVINQEFFAIAITEESAGSDIRAMQTRAVKVDGGYRLSGSKKYVARLEQASQVVVFAKLAPYDHNSLTAFVVPIHVTGLSVSRLSTQGLHGVSLGGLEIQNVFVPDEGLIGHEGEGYDLFLRHFTYWRTAMAAAAVGCARGSLYQVIDRLRNRQAFGGSLGRYTHLQQELAKHVAQVHMSWLLIRSTMERLEQGSASVVDGAMAKAEGVEAALAAVDWSMRVFGARGYTDQLDIEKRMRDLLGLRIADGTTDVLRGQIARKLLNREVCDLW